MIVSFEPNFPSVHEGEIDEVLRRISIGKGPGQWPTSPDRIHVSRTISGGRSGCDVIEIRVERGNQQSLKVVKIGPAYTIAGEYDAFKSHLYNCGRHFTRIEAVTPGVLSQGHSNATRREAIVYDHAQQFLVGSTCRTFEEVARQAIAGDDDDLHHAIHILRDLFKGLTSDLYTVTDSVGKSIDLYAFWNWPLGIDATIEVDRLDAKTKTFIRGPVTPKDLEQSKSSPRALRHAAAQGYINLTKGQLIHLENVRLTWWDDGRLIGEFEYGPTGVRIELVAPNNRLKEFVPRFKSETVFSICGLLKSLRTPTTRESLLKQLTEIREEQHVFLGKNNRTIDPFSILAMRLEKTPSGRFTSLVHGDLNPRNILVVDNLPCLIDYAHTRKGAPLLLDFVTLETCLAREALPHELTWSQHLRLQRLLAAAWRLGDQPHEFSAFLPKELSNAVQLLSTIRAAAYEVYAVHAPSDPHEWYRDYMENLFFFAHSTLKWESDTTATRAAAAIASVAAECIEPGSTYEYWTRDELLTDGVEIAQRLTRFIEEPPPKLGTRSKNVALAELAALSSGLDSLRRRPVPAVARLRPAAPVEKALECARVAFVRKEFFHLANDVLERRGRDHRQYIQLHAYIDLKGLVRETNERQDVLQVFASHPEIVLLGDAGGGKTTCAGEWEYYLARAIHPMIDEPPSIPVIANHPRLPIIVWAPALKRGLMSPQHHRPEWIVGMLLDAVTVPPEEASLGRTINVLREKLDLDQLALSDLLAAGALHLTVDGLNEVEPGDKQLIANWIIRLRELFPRTSVVACHRKFSYIENLFPRFRVVELEKVSEEQAKNYIRKIFGAEGQSLVGERLIQTIFQKTAEAVRDLAQTPLFLWMIVELYRNREVPPTGRGQLFREFAHWYMEEKHRLKQGVPSNPLYRYSYDEKAEILRCIGFALVKRQERTFSESEIFSFAPHVPKEKLLEMLSEVKDCEMLFISDGKYCFLHHSFQEFFAAWHFFKTEARDRNAVREKVDTYDWHDTIRMSVVFADLAPEAMEEIVQRSLVVNPNLAATVLRDAEFSDERLVALFINTLVFELRNKNSGASSWQTSAAALAEFGNATATEALFAIVGDTGVTGEARAEVIKELATLPNLTRFERQKVELQEKLVDVLTEVMRRGDEPIAVLIAAIDAVEKSQLPRLYTLLPSLVESKEAIVGNRAMEVCRRLGLVLPSSYEIKQTRDPGPTDLKQVHLEEDILQTRLLEAEEEIINQTNVSKMNQLNHRRTEILGNLASADNICLLLERRFKLGIDGQLKAMIDHVVKNIKETETRSTKALEILCEPKGTDTVTNRWARLVRSADACTAAAAAHRLAALGERLPAKVVQPLLEADLPPDRLCAIASLVSATNDRSLTAPLDELLEKLTGTVRWPDGIEPWVLLCKALYRLDRHHGNQRWIVGAFRFFHYRLYATKPGNFPLAYVEHDFSRDDEELEALMKRDGEYAKAALYQYSFWSVAALLTADRINSPGHLDQKNLKTFHTLAEAEKDPHQQTRLACAAVQLHAVELLPWITSIIKENRSLKTTPTTIYFGNYGRYSETLIGAVLRAKGYLARLQRDQGSKDESKLAHEELRLQYKSLSRTKDPDVLVGLTTALGFLGDWEPILKHLNQDYDYMLKAAHSVFDWWVPRIPEGRSERVRAAEWIAARLKTKTDLRPKERDTLRALHTNLCKELGRYIGAP